MPDVFVKLICIRLPPATGVGDGDRFLLNCTTLSNPIKISIMTNAIPIILKSIRPENTDKKMAQHR